MAPRTTTYPAPSTRRTGDLCDQPPGSIDGSGVQME